MKEKLAGLYVAMRDARTPWYAKALLVLVLAYLLSPIDIIPDFIPVIGLLDEAILLPVALAVIYRLLPEEVKQQDASITLGNGEWRRLLVGGVLLVCAVWMALILSAYWLWPRH